MDDKKTFIVPEAEIVVLFDIDTDNILISNGTNGWDDDDNTEVFGQ